MDLQQNKEQDQWITLMCERNGYNSTKNLTYHVYEVQINDIKVLSIDESTLFYKIVLAILLVIDLLFISMIIYQTKKTKHNNMEAD